jgi:hypothetical protein
VLFGGLRSATGHRDEVQGGVVSVAEREKLKQARSTNRMEKNHTTTTTPKRTRVEASETFHPVKGEQVHTRLHLHRTYHTREIQLCQRLGDPYNGFQLTMFRMVVRELDERTSLRRHTSPLTDCYRHVHSIHSTYIHTYIHTHTHTHTQQVCNTYRTVIGIAEARPLLSWSRIDERMFT